MLVFRGIVHSLSLGSYFIDPLDSIFTVFSHFFQLAQLAIRKGRVEIAPRNNLDVWKVGYSGISQDLSFSILVHESILE